MIVKNDSTITVSGKSIEKGSRNTPMMTAFPETQIKISCCVKWCRLILLIKLQILIAFSFVGLLLFTEYEKYIYSL